MLRAFEVYELGKHPQLKDPSKLVDVWPDHQQMAGVSFIFCFIISNSFNLPGLLFDRLVHITCMLHVVYKMCIFILVAVWKREENVRPIKIRS